MTEWSVGEGAGEDAGALPRPLAVRRPAGNRVRLRVRVPLDVLEATQEGLDGLDDARRQLGSNAPPPVRWND